MKDSCWHYHKEPLPKDYYLPCPCCPNEVLYEKGSVNDFTGFRLCKPCVKKVRMMERKEYKEI